MDVPTLDDPRLALARSIVVEDPDILGGLPVIRGTRVPVHDLWASLKAGYTPERVQAHYPWLTLEQIELAGVYAQAFPLPLRDEAALRQPPPGMVLVASYFVPHEAKGSEAS